MPDLEIELRRYGAHLDATYPDIALDEVVRRAPSRDLRPARRGIRLAVAVGLVAGLAGVGFLVVAGLRTGLDAPAPVIGPAPEVVVPDDTVDGEAPSDDVESADRGSALGQVMASTDGVYLVPLEAPEGGRLLSSGGSRIAWAMPDHQGGLIFQHDDTPEPWPRGAILWLAAGAATPEVLVAPASVWEPSSDEYPSAGLWPFGIATSRDEHAVFVYTAYAADGRANLMAADLDGSGTIRQLATLDARPGFWEGDPWVLVGGELVAVVEADPEQEDCAVVAALLRVDDGGHLPAGSDCLPGSTVGLRALSHDGRTLAAIDWPDLDGTAAARAFTVEVIEIATGASLEEATFDLDVRLDDVGLVPSPTGWLVYVQIAADWRIEGSGALRLLRLDGSERARIDRAPMATWRSTSRVGLRSNHFSHQPFELPPGASVAPPARQR
jgi:hypothetical protein